MQLLPRVILLYGEGKNASGEMQACGAESAAGLKEKGTRHKTGNKNPVSGKTRAQDDERKQSSLTSAELLGRVLDFPQDAGPASQ